MAAPAAFVGRERELSRLTRALGGDARLLLVTGDAGVGMTRLVVEGIARAGAAGMVMIRGECLPVAGTLPLLPVAAALGELAGLEGGGLMAALGTAPAFVRAEIGRLVPQLGHGSGPGADALGEGWQRGRLFAGIAQLLGAVAARSGAGVGLVVEDVHWADTETLDLLTFLSRAWHRDVVHVVVTCRGDEAPVREHVADWLAQVRGAAGMAELTLGPLSRAEVAGQVTALAGGPVPPGVVDELFARAEGNPFFTEQLVAAALADGPADGGLRVPAALPGRVAGLLAARAGRCAGEARAVLDALAVAGRPLGEDLLAGITGLEPKAVRRGLRELATARLLADDAPGEEHRPRHALLAEAVTGALLPGERIMLNERTARALEAAGDEALAGEAAGHWQAAGRPAEELTARVAAAGAAERVFGYAEAAGHWQRAIELWPDVPDAADAAGIGLPPLYVRAIDALYMSGDSERAGVVAEKAYRRFAGHTDPATAAIACHRAAFFRSVTTPAAGRPLLEEALRLFEQATPSAEHAAARYDYALSFQRCGEGGSQANVFAQLNRALEIAEAAGATPLSSRVLAMLGFEDLLNGRVEEGQALLDRGRALARASQDGGALVWQAVADSDVQLKLARFRRAAEVAVPGADAVRPAGLEASFEGSLLAANAAEGHEPLLAQIRALAERARIPLHAPAAVTPAAVTPVTPGGPPPAEPSAAYGLTGRELAVLRLLAAGRTNAQIGAELYISARTAGVHVTNILRKLGVSGRVPAAAVAERAGLLETRRPCRGC